ncbi:MAG: hypothetical protein LBT14_10910 [Treponema sp.]|jgi:hypothetical protein|nr:hypothetical protein [Treponema sp.]
MKKFVCKAAILWLLIFVTLIIIMMFPAPYNDYIQAIHDKHQRLINTTAPRIVLAGGSNLAFGIDSAALEKVLHIPVVNISIHAGIGLGRILDDIAPFLLPGDMLIIAPEYSHFTSEWNGNAAAYELIADTQNHLLLAHISRYGLPAELSTYTKSKLLRLIPQQPAYSRDGFNEYGDYIKHLETENQPITPKEPLGTINTTYLSQFFRLVDSFTRRGISVIITYPSYEETSFRNSTALIHELDAAFRTKQNITVISSPENYCFPVDFFYDTVYHLNAKGRETRTAQLIQDLASQFMQSITSEQ